MKKSYGFTALLLLPVLWSAIGCQQESTNPLDDRLMATLETSSYGNGLDYYKLPTSDNYSAIPQDPNNPITEEKVALGKVVFHETAFATETKFGGSMQAISCATCHHHAAGFQAGKAQGIADGGSGFGFNGMGRIKDPMCPVDSVDVQPIRTPSLLNVAYQKVMRWNGSMGATGSNMGTESQWTGPAVNNNLGFEGVETQSIVALKGHRQEVNQTIVNDNNYKQLFDAAFPTIPEQNRYTRQTAGLAMAAYSRTVLANEAPFQQWLNGVEKALTDDQKKGAILFFGEAGCYRCHNGPSLATEGFHAFGVKDLYQNTDATTYKTNVNNVENLGRGGFTGNTTDMYKFKVPQLYNVKDSPFEGHGGSFSSVREVVAYKNAGIAENPNVPASQLSPYFIPLNLTEEQIDQIADFIENGLHDNNLIRYVPTNLPSGLCFPNADVQSITDLGCQ